MINVPFTIVVYLAAAACILFAVSGIASTFWSYVIVIGPLLMLLGAMGDDLNRLDTKEEEEGEEG